MITENKYKIEDLINHLIKENKKEELKVLFYTLKCSNYPMFKILEVKYKDLVKGLK